eukprot:gene9181-12380_t
MCDIEDIKLVEMVPTEVPIDGSDSKDNDQSIKGKNPEGTYTPFHTVKSFWVSISTKDAAATIIISEDDYKSLGVLAKPAAMVDNFFHITDRNSSYYYEFTGGMTTFFSMAYIMVLNGVIIAGPYNTGISVNGVFFATTLSAGIFTFMMGLMVNVPVALAPGMGLNGFFATIAPACTDNPTGDINGTPCPGWGTSSLPWSDAMGAVFISGLLYLFFTFTGFRAMLFRAVPPSLRASITVGIGFFITIIGLKIGEVTRVTVQPWAIGSIYTAGGCATYDDGTFCDSTVDLNFTWYELGIAKFNDVPAARIAVLGLVLVSALEAFKVKGAIIISIVLTSFVGINYVHCHSLKDDGGCVTNLSAWSQKGGPNFIVNVNDIPSGKLTFKYADMPFFWNCVFTFLFVECFDSFGTLTGLMTRCGFMKGDPEIAMNRVNRAMLVDGFGLALGGVIGANSITCFVESNTGVEAGARTGLASIVTGSAFLLSLLFVQPFVGLIPDAATMCALVMVGIHSLYMVQDINFSDFIDQLTAFLMIATMGFTYSIANGICAGFIFFCWLRTIRFCLLKASQYFKWEAIAPQKDVETDLPHPLMYAMACFMAVRFAYLKS